MFRAGVVMLLIVLAGRGRAEDLRPSIERCREIEDSLLRLQCYDGIANGTAAGSEDRATVAGQDDGSAASIGDTGAWTVQEETNPIDDTTTVVASLVAASSDGQQLSGPVELYLRCRSGKTEAFLSWRSFLGGSAKVTTRFGKGKPESRTWPLSSDRLSTFHPGSGVAFATKLLTASTLAAEVVGRTGPRVSATFELSGAEAAVAQVRRACGW